MTMKPALMMQTGNPVTVPIGPPPGGGGADGVPTLVNAFQFSGLQTLSAPVPMKVVLDAVFPNPNPAAAPGGNYDGFAVIKWGGPRTSCSVEVDLGTSTTVSVYGSSVVVDIGYRRTAADGLQPPPPVAIVNAQLVIGADSGASQAQRTTRYGSVAAAGTSPTFDIPKYAKRVRVLGSDPAALPDYTLLFYAWGDVIAASPMSGDSVAIPNSANRMAIVNRTAAAQTLRAVFDLYL